MSKHYRSFVKKTSIFDNYTDHQEVIVGADCNIYTVDGFNFRNVKVTKNLIHTTLKIKTTNLTVTGNTIIRDRLEDVHSLTSGAIEANKTMSIDGTCVADLGSFSGGVSAAGAVVFNGDIYLTSPIYIKGRKWSPTKLTTSSTITTSTTSTTI